MAVTAIPYDELETRDPEKREHALFAELPALVAFARESAPAYGRLYAEVDAATMVDRAALARLPVVRKSDLVEAQRAERPFAGLVTVPIAGLKRVFASPGPIYDPEGPAQDWWRFARALHAAGFANGELLHNCFSYHFTPAGSMVETGAHALGCAVFPGGVGQTEQQAQAVSDLRPAGYAGTPSFLKLILEKADELRLDCSSLTKALVSGEALPASLRDWFGARGIAVLQCYATADLGLIAYESPAREGLILDEAVIVEIVRPGTGDPLPEGEVGEVLVTSFNADYPLIRFATGDLSAILPGASPCGRTNTRLRGWMGRADQTTKVKGMFVHPGQIAEVLKRHGIACGRLVVDKDEAGADRMVLHCAGPAEAGAIAETLQALTKLRGAVVGNAELPNDGKIIEDRRPAG